MKAHLVGAGGMGRAWAQNLAKHPGVEVVGWTDILPGAATRAARELELDIAILGGSLPADLERSQPDFVVDVTTPESHRDVTVFALGQGLPVLGEKPMAHSLEAAREMIAASERSGKLYMVSQSRRYEGGIVAFRQLADELGGVEILNADFYLGPHFGGFRDEMDSPLLVDMAIHTFEAARYLSRTDAVRVYCDEFNPSWSWYAGKASATTIFEMANGGRFTYRGSWCAEGLNTSWESEWRALGPRGTAVWDGFARLERETPSSDSGFIREQESFRANRLNIASGITGSLDEFLEALRTGSVPQGECHDNFRSLAMVFAAVESARRGEKVPVESA